jgi:hypothetical protein
MLRQLAQPLALSKVMTALTNPALI